MADQTIPGNLFVDESVGIGTNEPQAKLDIRGSVVVESGGNPTLFGGTGNQEHNRHLQLLNSPHHRSALGLKTGGLLVSDRFAFADPGKNDLIVKGKVGIGTASPETKLKVQGGSAKFVTNNASDPLIVSRFERASSSQGTQELRIGVGDSVTTLHYINDEATNKIEFRMDNRDTETGGGRNANNKVVMTIFGSNRGGGINVDGVALKPGGGSWGSLSDRRLKRDIKPLTGALPKLLDLNGSSFEWKAPDQNGNLTGPQIGMTAQDVEKVFPDWVAENSEGFKYVTFRGFEALTVEAFRELKSETQSKIADLEARLSALEEKLQQIVSVMSLGV